MRVGVRRLRSNIANLAIALNLPTNVTEENLGEISRNCRKVTIRETTCQALRKIVG